jgi:hypothetical protein
VLTNLERQLDAAVIEAAIGRTEAYLAGQV